MAYHTPLYLLIFLPLVLIAYQLTPPKKRWVILLTASYIFFYSFSGKLVLVLIGTTLFIHYIGLWLFQLQEERRSMLAQAESHEKNTLRKLYKKRERHVLTGGILSLLAVLGYLKYSNFFLTNVNMIWEHFGWNDLFSPAKLILPIGISFYTLQAISYIVDVYWEKIPVQKHLGNLALYLAFFPQLMEGPISVYHQTSDQLFKGESIRWDNLRAGIIRILWGLFKKIVIADRLNAFVGNVFDNHHQYSGAIIVLAAVAYTIQLYMEFSGCMDIVLGSGRLFGITLPENFRQPFASKNAAEFWRRWHITLGIWLKTYVFYPVSTSQFVKKWNKFGKKHLNRYVTRLGVTAISLFPVWFINGIWHGASWNYIFFGLYYFVILLAGTAFEPVREKLLLLLHIDEDALPWHALQVVKTWGIIVIGELIFRASGMKSALEMIVSVFQNPAFYKLWDGSVFQLGLDVGDFQAIVFGVGIVAIIGHVRERNLIAETTLKKCPDAAFWALCLCLSLSIIILGAYGYGYQQVDLIYAGF